MPSREGSGPPADRPAAAPPAPAASPARGTRMGRRTVRTAPRALGAVRGGDAAAVELHEVPDDGQAQPQPPAPAGGGGLALAEALEDVGQELRLDPGPRVRHGQGDLGPGPHPAHGDLSSSGRELDGVRHEVPHDLLEPVGVAHQGPRLRVHGRNQGHAFALRGRPHGVEGRPDHGHELEGLELDAQAAGHDAGDVHQLGDQARLQLGVARDRVEGALHRGRIRLAFRAEDVGPAQDRGERRAQLVGHGGQELVLQPARLLEALLALPERLLGVLPLGALLEERPGLPGPGQGDPGLAAQPLQEREVLFAEGAVRPPGPPAARRSARRPRPGGRPPATVPGASAHVPHPRRGRRRGPSARRIRGASSRRPPARAAPEHLPGAPLHVRDGRRRHALEGRAVLGEHAHLGHPVEQERGLPGHGGGHRGHVVLRFAEGAGRLVSRRARSAWRLSLSAAMPSSRRALLTFSARIERATPTTRKIPRRTQSLQPGGGRPTKSRRPARPPSAVATSPGTRPPGCAATRTARVNSRNGARSPSQGARAQRTTAAAATASRQRPSVRAKTARSSIFSSYPTITPAAAVSRSFLARHPHHRRPRGRVASCRALDSARRHRRRTARPWSSWWTTTPTTAEVYEQYLARSWGAASRWRRDGGGGAGQGGRPPAQTHRDGHRDALGGRLGGHAPAEGRRGHMSHPGGGLERLHGARRGPEGAGCRVRAVLPQAAAARKTCSRSCATCSGRPAGTPS